MNEKRKGTRAMTGTDVGGRQTPGRAGGLWAVSVRIGLAGGLLLLLLILSEHLLLGYSNDSQAQQMQRTVGRAERLFNFRVNSDARAMERAAMALMRDSCIRDAFVARERERLQRCAEPALRELHETLDVTHLYFHLPDRVNFLRVHHPERHGDRIERITMEEAVSQGKASSGMELGTFGTFTLRSVVPWTGEQGVLGYIEVGKETGQLDAGVREGLGVELLTLLDKRFIKRPAWEEGQRMMGLHEDWDEYPDVVAVDRTSSLWIPDMAAFTHHHHSGYGPDPIISLLDEGRRFMVGAFPLNDAARRNVGHVVVIDDMSTAVATAVSAEYWLLSFGGLIVVAVIGGMLVNERNHRGIVRRQGEEIERLRGEQGRSEENLAEGEQRWRREINRFQRAIMEERILNDLLRLAATPNTLDEYLRQSLQHLISSIHWLDHLPEGALFLTQREGGHEFLKLSATYNLSTELVQRCARVEYGQCLCGKAAEAREVLFIGEVDERHDITFTGMVPHGHYVIPILDDDRLVGVFNVYLPPEAGHDIQDELFLTRAAEVFAVGISCRADREQSAADGN